MKISACYIVKDAIHTLPYSIKHTLEIADEIIIIDTGSTDGTIGYLKDMDDNNEKITIRYDYVQDSNEFNFADARNYAKSECNNEWILFLDADEYIDKVYAEKLKKYIIENSNQEGFVFQCNNFMESPFWKQQPVIFYGTILRLFRNKPEYQYKGIVHEKLQGIDEKKCMFIPDVPLYHFQYHERNNAIEKMSDYLKKMDIKVKEEGWTAENYIHYGDCYRRKHFWRGNIDDLKLAISYFEKSLRVKKNSRIQQIVSSLKFMEKQYYERQQKIKEHNANRKNGNSGSIAGSKRYSDGKNKNRKQGIRRPV